MAGDRQTIAGVIPLDSVMQNLLDRRAGTDRQNSKRNALYIRHQNTIYIYIYVCICVCVCALYIYVY